MNTNDTDFNAPNKTGGAKTVTLGVTEIPSHQHQGLKWADSTNPIVIGNVAGSNMSMIRVPWTGNGVTGDATKIHTNFTGGGKSHQNLSPYQTVYIWRRAA